MPLYTQPDGHICGGGESGRVVTILHKAMLPEELQALDNSKLAGLNITGPTSRCQRCPWQKSPRS
jgi:hypothetical protein